MSESDFEVASTVGHGPGESTLFLPGDTVFWLPYALSELYIQTASIATSYARYSLSSCLAAPSVRFNARLSHTLVGSLFQGCTIAYIADL